jgi:hypothetical protein
MSAEYHSYDEESLNNFFENKRLTGIEELDKIINQYRLGQWFDNEGYEDQGLSLILSAINKATKIPNGKDREKIADILFPEQ